MTLRELAATLPNGFHDAQLRRFEMDYVERRLRFDLDVWIGDMENAPARELYRPARLTVDEVAYLVIEPPDVRYSSRERDVVVIDAGEGRAAKSESHLPEPPAGTSITWMYLGAMNRYLHFASGNASLEWIGPEENRTLPRKRG
jgi:hypothetical protein